MHPLSFSGTGHTHGTQTYTMAGKHQHMQEKIHFLLVCFVLFFLCSHSCPGTQRSCCLCLPSARSKACSTTTWLRRQQQRTVYSECLSCPQVRRQDSLLQVSLSSSSEEQPAAPYLEPWGWLHRAAKHLAHSTGQPSTWLNDRAGMGLP